MRSPVSAVLGDQLDLGRIAVNGEHGDVVAAEKAERRDTEQVASIVYLFISIHLAPGGLNRELRSLHQPRSRRLAVAHPRGASHRHSPPRPTRRARLTNAGRPRVRAGEAG